MFTIKIARRTQNEEVMFEAADVRYADNILTLDGIPVSINSGDTAFVMNSAGATVSKYQHYYKQPKPSTDEGTGVGPS